MSSLREVSLFHMRQGSVFETVRNLAKELERNGIDYAVAGGLAVSELGYARATMDVDILMTRDGLASFRERGLGRGYLPAFNAAVKTFRDSTTGVRIKVLTTGDFPGDGKQKPVAFPDPGDVAVQGEDFRYLRLESLLELKLASGLTAPHRLRDLADVQDLIVATSISASGRSRRPFRPRSKETRRGSCEVFARWTSYPLCVVVSAALGDCQCSRGVVRARRQAPLSRSRSS